MAGDDGDGDGLVRGEDGRRRCWWCAEHGDYRAYHDAEWGRPVAANHVLFEKICLEGFQSGLSWLTILRKRGAFRRAFARFDCAVVARFGRRDVARLLADASIVRHRGKIESAIGNARRALALVEEFGSRAAFFREFAPAPAQRPRRLTRAALRALARTPESAQLSRELRRRGWTFVGPTTCYAFRQAIGLVNDHLHGCWVRARVESARGRAAHAAAPPPRAAWSPPTSRSDSAPGRGRAPGRSGAQSK